MAQASAAALGAWWCGRAGVGLGEGGLGVGEDQAVAGADAKLGRVADEIGRSRVGVPAGVDEHRVGRVVVFGDGGIGDAAGGVAAQGRRDSADGRRAAPVMGQVMAPQPLGQARQRMGGGAAETVDGLVRISHDDQGQAEVVEPIRMYTSAAEQSCASSTTSSAYLAVSSVPSAAAWVARLRQAWARSSAPVR